jgi:hydroxypyruvate isomerase
LTATRPIRCSANIAFLFPDQSIVDGLEAARANGFRTVELADPYGVPTEVLVAALSRLGLEVGLANVATGRPDRGDRGFAGDPTRKDEFEAELERAAAFAGRVRPAKVNVLSGIRRNDLDEDAQLSQARRALALASRRLAPLGVQVVTELLNSTYAPGFLLSNVDRAIELLAPLDANVGLQLDIYHLQLAERDLLRAIRRLGPLIGHVQVADVPFRTEPGTGELDIHEVLAAIAAAGYDSVVGLEYGPSSPAADLFGWMAAAGCIRA